MKKLPLYILSGVLVFMLGVLCTLLYTRHVPPKTPGDPGETPSEGGEAVTSETLTDKALEVAAMIKARDYGSLADCVHPVYGLLFSPYATVNPSTNRSFSVNEIRTFGSNTETYVWGILSGTNAPIRLTVEDYFGEYVFDRDYTQASIIGINYLARVGNALENVTDSFPGAQFVDLCYPGSSGTEVQDWSILRLVFEEYNGSMMLSAVIHSEATI